MSFVNTIRQWDEGVAYADGRDWVAALRTLLDIQDTNSKILFNIGCLHLINQELDAAEKAFDNSIRKDEHLAVSFFQRGITFYKKLKFEESLGDFQNAFTELRGNQLIDYKPLGLRYKLYACEVLHNVALAQAQLGQWEKAQGSLLTALNLKTESKHGHIDQALESVLKQKLFEPVEIQAGALFRPNKHYVAELEKKDYLGKAKVVASIIPKDAFSGFAPLQPQVEVVPTRQKIPEVLRALEGEPHSVLYEFIAETAEEMTLLPGNIVFVLQRGSDNWASVFFNGKRGLVPYSFLEPVEITLSSKQGLEGTPHMSIPAPPRGTPPTRPENGSALDPSQMSAMKTSDKDDKMRKIQMCTVKVHFTYTIALRTVIGLPYSSLLQRISEKLSLPMQTITLSYKAASNRINADDMGMENIWRSVQNYHLTLWCDVSKEKENRPQGFVAIHAYEALRPEDLEFRQGDVITVLSKVNEQWLEGQCNGKVGIFPACYVEKINQSSEETKVIVPTSD
ncbi:hypothetical protein AAFF_G00354510 [Aldrovandia affinis]|uniref:SH3 domain-containing protein n=1 Tax=Aldrovandia affinis TaxID=143900 RepID=A0AAD7SII2_9TELE|nr:hypothetical protein AAFF_G00354510 [Aldrovandia affinis]